MKKPYCTCTQEDKSGYPVVRIVFRCGGGYRGGIQEGGKNRGHLLHSHLTTRPGMLNYQ